VTEQAIRAADSPNEYRYHLPSQWYGAKSTQTIVTTTSSERMLNRQGSGAAVVTGVSLIVFLLGET
jgi:hypothetical protein